MNSKRFKEARARVLAHKKSFVPPGTSNTPSALRELAAVMIKRHSNHLASSSRKKTSDKKKKAASCSASPLSQEGLEVKLINTDERTSARKVRRVS